MDPARNPRARPRSALSARVARWLQPPRTLRPTRAGWTFFGLTFGVGFAALNTGNNLLYLVLSLMLAFLVLSGVLSESALRGIRVRRRLPRELFAGEDGSVALEVVNALQRVPAFAVVIEDLWTARGSDEVVAGRAFALRIGPGERALRGYRLCASQRGRARFNGFRVSTRFPFGLFSKARYFPSGEETLVFPAVEPVEPKLDHGRARNAGARETGGGGRGVEAAGLREYASGDAARRIHWRASVRRGTLMVRDVESEHDAEVEVRLRTRGVRAGDGFERRVVRAASDVVALLDAGMRVALRTEARHFPADHGSHHRARLLAFLALVQPGVGSEAPS